MKKLLAKIPKILRDRRTRQFLTRFVSVTAAIVVFVTTYALVLPAITMEREANCGIPAHQHDDSCYEEVLVCGLEESDDHQHTADCYEKKLICGMEAHTHSAACYSDEVSADNEETGAVAAAHTLTSTVSGDEKVFAAYTGGFGGTNAAAEGSIQSSDGNDNEENGDADSSESGGLSDNNNESLEIGRLSNDADTALNDSQEAPETASTDDQEFHSAQNAESEGTEYSDEDNNTTTDTASENDTVTDGDIAEGNDAAEETAIQDTDPTAAKDLNDDSETGVFSEGDEAGTYPGENINAEPYVPALEPVDFNTVLTSSTGIYYYHKDTKADVETDADAEEDNKTTPVTSAEITDWEPVEEGTVLGPEDLIRVYLRYSVPAGKLNETNNVARYRLPENLVLSDEQITAINKAENGISAQYMDYATLEVKDPVAHEESLGIEAIEGTRTPDQDVDEYLAGNSTSVGDAREYISAIVKVENIYETDDTDERYEGATADYENGDHADNGEDGSEGTWLGQDLIFTFTPYTVEKNQHKYDSSGQQTRTGEDVDGWLTLDFNMSQVKWVETDRDAQAEEQVLETESENEKNTGPSVEKANNIAETPVDPADTDIDSDNTISGTNAEQLSDNKAEELNNETPDVRKSSKTVRTATANRKEAEIVFVKKVEEDRENNIEAIDEISTKLILAENFFEETEASVEDETVSTSADNNADKDSADKDEAITADDEPKSETEKTLDNKTAVAMPAAVFDDSITVTSGSLSSDTRDTELDDTTITVHVEADEDTFPAGTRMVLGTVSDEQMESVSAAVEEAVANDENISNKTRGFHAVDISFRDADGNEIEPLKPIRVSMKSDEIRRAVEDNNTAPVVIHVSDPADTKERSEDDSKNGSEERKSREDAPLVANIIETVETTEDQNETKDSSDAGEAENRDSSDTLSFESDSFSIYAVVYTVDFHYTVDGQEYEYSIKGGSYVSLKEIVAITGLYDQEPNYTSKSDAANGQDVNDTQTDNNTPNSTDGQNSVDSLTAEALEKSEQFIKNVADVEFSNTEYIAVVHPDEFTTVGALKDSLGLVCEYSEDATEEEIALINATEIKAKEWGLISLKPFESEETLTIAMKDGSIFIIKVTDAQENPYGLGGKSFVVVNYRKTTTNDVIGYNYGTPTYKWITHNNTPYYVLGNNGAMTQANSYNSQPKWTFTYLNEGKQFLMQDQDGDYLYIDNASNQLRTTGDEDTARANPFIARMDNDIKTEHTFTVGNSPNTDRKTQAEREYIFTNKEGTLALARIGNGSNNNPYSFGVATVNYNSATQWFALVETNGTPGEIATADNNEDNIRVTLYDYGPNDLDYEASAWVNNNNSNNLGAMAYGYDVGINNGHGLKFSSHGTDYSDTNHISINSFSTNGYPGGSTENVGYRAIQGIVKSALDSEGYPILAPTVFNDESLKYLFDPKDIMQGNTYYKKVYKNVNHLFVKDERGYYRYDSNQNYAYYDKSQGDSGNFKVYASTFNEEGTGEQEGIGFFPFDDYNSNNKCIHGKNGFTYWAPHGAGGTTTGLYNHHFGMMLETNFIMTPDGKYLGDDISFDFSGDDDLWVFVDGVLVLDIGGIHSPVGGNINFNTGKVTVGSREAGHLSDTDGQLTVKYGNSYTGQPGPTSIKEAFSRVTGKEWDDSPYTRHSLKVFYLERGGMYSNLAISFNMPTYKTITLEKELEGLTETQLERYNDEYYYYQVKINNTPYTGIYGVLTRPATESELEDWVKEYTTVDGKQVYVGGHWKDGTAHGDTETINKDDKIVRWHIPVNDGIIRIKPGWTFTIEELGLNDKFSVAELYGYDESFQFEDGQVDTRQSADLMKDFFAPTAEYFYSEDLKDPSAVDFDAKEESLELHEVNDPGPKAWTSETKNLQYSDYILFTNTMPTKLEVEKEWTDSNKVDHNTNDYIEYKIYRTPYQIFENPDYDPDYNPANIPGDDPDEPLHPEKLSKTKRVDKPIQEVRPCDDNHHETDSTSSIGYVSMEGFTGTLSFNSTDNTKSWKETVSNLPTVGWYIHEDDSNRIRVLYEYSVKETLISIEGYKPSITGGLITNDATQQDREGEYKFTITNEPVSPIDRFTQIDIQKEWKDAKGELETDVDIHKDDFIEFEVKQTKYKAMTKVGEGDNAEYLELYPITINLVDEDGVPSSQGGKRHTDRVIVYVPKGAEFTIEPQYNDLQHGGSISNESEHVVCVDGIPVTDGITPRTIPKTSNGAPNNTFYYPNSPQVSFTFDSVDSAQEVTLWLYAGKDEWLYLYDNNDPTNYLDKGEQTHAVPDYHVWTCQLYCDKEVIWDLEEVYYHIIEANDAYDLEEYPSETTNYKYEMRLVPNGNGGYTTRIYGEGNAPGSDGGGSADLWSGSIMDLPLYKLTESDGNVETYIYTYEIKEKKIDSDDVKPLVTPVTLEGTTYKYQSSSYYVSWPDNTLFDAAHTHSDGIKFTNRKLPIIKAALYKVDKNDLNATSPNTLSGAEFTLWKYNLINGVFSKDQTWPADGKELIEDPPDSGVFSLGDLTEGYYKIEETLFPAGYVQSDEVPMLYVKMGDNGEMEAVLVRASSPNIGQEIGNLTDIVKIGNETVSGNKIWTVTLGNECGTELPSAGGSGTDFFYFVGCILTMLAGASLVMKKNMRSGD